MRSLHRKTEQQGQILGFLGLLGLSGTHALLKNAFVKLSLWHDSPPL